MMRRMFAVLARLRPRVVTLLLLASIAASITVANLSGECGERKVVPGPELPADFWSNKNFVGTPPKLISKLDFDVREPTAEDQSSSNAMYCMSYGWPLLWRQYLFLGIGYPAACVVGEAYSSRRLVANLAIWLFMLATPAAVCEWLLRRYRPRLRFSLRTLLAGMGLVAALCGWFASARNRANVQNPLIEAIGARGGRVWIERWGPKWLDLVGSDRLRRRIVGVEINAVGGDFRERQRLLGKFNRLPDLQYFSLKAKLLTPEMAGPLSELHRVETLQIELGAVTRSSGLVLADVLGGLRRLRVLSVDCGSSGLDVEVGSHECLAAISNMPQLEHVHLQGWTIAREDLALLAALTKLKSLTLNRVNIASKESPPDPPLLARLPALPQLESLDLEGSYVYDEDLRYLGVLPRLKSLGLQYTEVTGAGLAELARLESLEELTLDEQAESAAGFKSLLNLKRLKFLHMELFDKESWESRDSLRELLADLLPAVEIDDCILALEALRTAKPDLVIDDAFPLEWPAESLAPKCETLPEASMAAAARQAVRVWKEQQAAAATPPGAVNPPASN
ncbi:MAG TPA: hypothetical protein VMV10_25520 [Pirellulales bacterium]|nr:hypothetical protein [Pirellulales bacterium]